MEGTEGLKAPNQFSIEDVSRRVKKGVHRSPKDINKAAYGERATFAPSDIHP
jgi:hypothetical protein